MHRVEWRAAGALVLFGAIALALGTGFGLPQDASAQQASPPTATPTPPPASLTPVPTLTPLPIVSATPTNTPAPRGRRGRPAPAPSSTKSAAPEATATPTSPAFSTLDGNWEVQVQRIDTTIYSRMTLKQDGSNVTGMWFVEGKNLPFDGTYDGRLFHFVAKGASGNLDLSGYVESSTNMVGIVDNGKGEIPNANPLPFTAEHRGAKPPPYPRKKPG